jgi:hypothetical protein
MLKHRDILREPQRIVKAIQHISIHDDKLHVEKHKNSICNSIKSYEN